MKFFLLLILILFSSVTYALDLTTPEEREVFLKLSRDEVESALNLVRKSDSVIDQKRMLELSLHYLRTNVAKDLNLTPETLGLKFQEEGESFGKELLQGKYKTLFTEFSLLDKFLRAKEKFGQCEDYFYQMGANKKDLEVSKSIFQSFANSCTVNEGGFDHSYRTYLTKDAKGKTKEVAIPNFSFASNLDQLLHVSKTAELESLLNPKNPLEPTEAQLKKLFPKKDNDGIYNVALKVKMRSEGYIRAVTNSMKTMMTYGYLSGQQTWTELDEMAMKSLNQMCPRCTLEQKQVIRNRALNDLSHEVKTNHMGENLKDKSRMVDEFCQDLKDQNYNFDVYKKVKSPSMVGSDVLQAVHDKQIGEIEDKIFYDNYLILKNLTLKKNGGALMLTKALNRLDLGGKPHQTNLSCEDADREKDTAIVQDAVREGQANVLAYTDKLNKHIDTTKNSEKQLDDDIKYLVDLNPTAMGEALANYEEGTQLVCNAIYSNAHDKRLKEFGEEALLWGTAVVGVALTVSGIGSGVGLGLLLAVDSAAIVAFRTASFYVEAEAHKAKSEEYMEAFKGSLFGTEYLMNMNEEEFKKYGALENKFEQNLAMMPIEIFSVVSLSLKYGKTLTAVESQLNKILSAGWAQSLSPKARADIVVFGLLEEKPVADMNLEEILQLMKEAKDRLLVKKFLTPDEVIKGQALYRTLDGYDMKSGLKSLNFLIVKSLKKNLQSTGVKSAMGANPASVPTLFISNKGSGALNIFKKKLSKILGVKNVSYDLPTLSNGESQALGMYMPGYKTLQLSDKAVTTGKVTEIELHETIHAYFDALRNDAKLLASRGIATGRSSPFHTFATALEGKLSNYHTDYPTYQTFEESVTHSVANINGLLRKILDKGKITADDLSDVKYFLNRTRNLGKQQEFVTMNGEKMLDKLYKDNAFFSSQDVSFLTFANSPNQSGVKFVFNQSTGSTPSQAELVFHMVTEEERALADTYNKYLVVRGKDAREEIDTYFYKFMKLKFKDAKDASKGMSKVTNSSMKQLDALVNKVGLEKELSKKDISELTKILRAPGNLAKEENLKLRPMP